MKRIYVAEDQPAQAELMETILSSQRKYSLNFFNNGLELYRRVQQEPPDMLILDIMMPMLSGLAIARLLKFHDDFSKIPVLIVSSITDPDIQARALRAGADAFLPKPFEVATLVENVNRLLGEVQPPTR
ncbi:MAG: response regulator [Armatimonadetes bacterium]|nr:response regulator [Armatimonadota bacterium]